MNGMGHPIIKDVVLVGAGHAHVQVLRRFGMKTLPGVRFTLITREVHTPYSGMLPGLIAGRYGFDEAHIDTGPLARFAGARLYQSAVTGIDLEARRVICDNRPPVPYDVLSINTGSTPNTGVVPGADEYAIPVKPIDGFLERLAALRERIEASGWRRRIAVVGGGAGGVELLLSLETRLRREARAAGRDPTGLSFVLVTDELLERFPAGFRQRFEQIFADRGIQVTTGARITRVSPEGMQIEGGDIVPADEILWTTEARAPDWLRSTGLGLDEAGFIKVDETLRAEGQENVFAAGDVTSFGPRPLPKSGVYAVRTGPVLADNIRQLLEGRRLRPFKPQRDAMYLVSTGEEYAIGTRNGFVFAGAWVWRWKDWIDRRFMRRFNDLPDMAAKTAQAASSPIADEAAIKEISAFAMRCGGCGAKVGATVLSRALGAIEPAVRPEVLVGLDAPDDAAVMDTGGRQLAVHSVDYFRAIIDDPYLFGRIAANHALGDIFAMGAEPLSALAIATVPYGLEAKVEADLSAMMTGANESLSEAGCALVGGHTSEGAELALGFAVNGVVARQRFLRKGGMQPGDVLILTKPIGTGTLLAADMRGKAKARWVMAAIRHMTRSNAAAAKILHAHDAHAATDVTGFGLIGHLVEMVKASGVDVSIALHAVPLLPGVRETIAGGIFSSLQPQNVRLRRTIRNLEEAARDPLYPTLFDPQTAGGLLAAVPAQQAASALQELHAAGYREAAVIGTVQPQSDVIEPIRIVTDPELTGQHLLANEWGSDRVQDSLTEQTHAHQPVL